MPELPGAAVLHGLLVLLVLWLLVAPLMLVGCCGSSYMVGASPEAPPSLRRCDGVLPHVPIQVSSHSFYHSVGSVYGMLRICLAINGSYK